MTEQQLRIYNALKPYKESNFEELDALGVKMESSIGGCGQCTLFPFIKLIGLDERIFKTASAFCAGIGEVYHYPCGAFTGGVILLSEIFGRGMDSIDKEDGGNSEFRLSCSLVRDYESKFSAIYGGVCCSDVHTQMFGRPYNLLINEDWVAFQAAGGHTDKCPHVVGSAVKMLAELIFDTLDQMQKA